MVNAAIAVYYYLCVVREAWFRDPGDLPSIHLDWPTRTLCILLIGGILALGIFPARVLKTISSSIDEANLGPRSVPTDGRGGLVPGETRHLVQGVVP